MSNELIQYGPKEIDLTNLETVKNMAEIFIRSGFFSDVKTASQGIVKILAGKEIGLAPIQAMQQVHVIPSQNGPKIQLSGNIIASKIKQSGKYDYRIVLSSEKVCEIDFFKMPENLKLGSYKFTIDDAVKAGLTNKSNWKNYPRDMLFNRCISGGYKQHTPDIFNITVYSEADEFESIQDRSERKIGLEQRRLIGKLRKKWNIPEKDFNNFLMQFGHERIEEMTITEFNEFFAYLGEKYESGISDESGSVEPRPDVDENVNQELFVS